MCGFVGSWAPEESDGRGWSPVSPGAPGWSPMRSRALSLSKGTLTIQCTKDAPEQNAHKWQSLRTERDKQVSMLCSGSLGLTTGGAWLSKTSSQGTHCYCASAGVPVSGRSRLSAAPLASFAAAAAAAGRAGYESNRFPRAGKALLYTLYSLQLYAQR